MRWAVLILALAGTLPGQSEGKQNPPIQGITISTHGNGRDWGSDRIVPCIAEIHEVGANWISIHPYATIHGSGRVTWRKFGQDDPPAELVRPIREAHKKGLKVFIKPHLAYWGSPFRWRGDIAFGDDEKKWSRFFKTYAEWTVAIAEACKDADGFSIGTELDKTLRYEKQWREIIANVRRVTKAPLTYAANWTDYDRVPFWDALDIIGIQAYFPLTEKRNADSEELRAGWKKTMAKLRAFSIARHRNIVFTELGYTTSFSTAIRPWESHDDGRSADAYQRLCMRIALAAIAAEPRVEGSFLWKWFPPPSSVGRDFPLATKDMKKTIAEAWKQASQGN